MADIDTIVVLDGIMQQKETTSDVWTIDAAGSANEAVKTYAVAVPVTASGVRVLFNNTYDADGSRVHVRVRCTKLTSMAAGTPTKTEDTQLLEWTAIAQAAFLETGAEDVSAAIQAVLHIDCAITSTTAHTGTEIICQVQSEAALDEWTTFCTFIGPTGTAVKSDFAAQEAAAQTILSVTDPTTGGLDNVGKFIFLEDTATIAKCEIAYLVECGADA